MHVVAFATAILLAAASNAAAQYSIDVVAADGRATTVSLDGLERKTVITGDRGRKTTFEGVAMHDVLSKAGIKLGEALKGKALAQVVLATAKDGYQVAYAIAEVDAAFTDQVVLIADTRDQRPLIADSGPLQIVVPLDKRAARWMRQVIKLEVKQLQ